MITFDKSISVKELQKLMEPFVYAWHRNGEYLYIGCTNNGFQRLLSHNIIGKVEPFQDNDFICFWFSPEPWVLERKLIAQEKPKYNFIPVKHIPKEKQHRIYKYQSLQIVKPCLECQIPFKPKRSTDFICWRCKSQKLKVDFSLAAMPKAAKFTKKVQLPH